MISGAVLAPIALGSVWIGGAAFIAVLWVATALLAREWALMSTPATPIRTAASMAGALLAVLLAAGFAHFKTAWVLLPIGAVLAAIFAAARRWDDRPADEAVGVLYIGAPALALVWLRSGSPGLAWTLTLLATTWAADIAAYVVGNLIKGPKLWPRISPNKTWSGFVAGLIAAMLACWAISTWQVAGAGPPVRWAWMIGLVVGFATMAGDLLESMLKRRFGVKDSGDLIPGHGGLLDRVDGLMFASLAMAAARALLHFGGAG